MIFKTHAKHIGQLKGAIRAFGPVYFHGDGNIYKVSDDKNVAPGESTPSEFRKKFGNPKAPESSYRIRFDSISEVPNNIEDINAALTRSKDNEVLESQKSVDAGVNTFEAWDDEEEAKEPETKKAGRKKKETENEGE